MANCHHLFQRFISEISLTPDKKKKMSGSKNALRDRIRKHFNENHPEYVPQFYIQGSYKMKTAIRTKDDICDLDDGVYFFREPDITSTTLQGWIWDAVNGYTDTTPEHKKKCIRSIFAGDYEIDMPVYYKIDNKQYQLAIKNIGWENSDPKAMVDWLNARKDKDGQILRIIKDLKAWCDFKRNRMPSGLAMTILAVNAKAKIVLNDRDDITLKDILKEIKKELDANFACIVPVTPYDNLFGDYDEARRENFMNVLNDFIDDAEKALKEENELKASRLWKKHLGDRFPEGEDKKQEQSIRSSSVSIGAVSSNPWGQ